MFFYKKGNDNAVADAVSRIPTNGHTVKHPDLDIPCYFTLDSVDSDQTESDCEAGEQTDDVGQVDHFDYVLANSDITELEEPPEGITLEEMLRVQQDDEFCKLIRSRLTAEWRRFREDPQSGLLQRVVYEHPQTVVPKSIQPRLLNLAHGTVIGAHCGDRKMYKTLQRDYYWPGLAVDCYNVVRSCVICAKERVRRNEKKAPMKLFPATAPLEDISMDILGPLIETPHGNAYILVITDRYSKLTRSIPMSSVKAIDVARTFLSHWVYAYGPPKSMLTDNGTQFASRFLLETYRILGIKGVFTATYHPQTNGQPERYNSTLLAALRNFVGEHPKTWDQYAEALSFGYNSHVHDVIGFAPFDLVVSRPTPSLFLEIPPAEYTLPRQTQKEWLLRLRSIMEKATQQLQERQRRYKAAFDARVRARPPIAVGDYVFIRKLSTTRRD